MTYCSYQDKILPFLRPVGSKRQGRAALNSKILNYVTFPRFANSDLRFSSKDFIFLTMEDSEKNRYIEFLIQQKEERDRTIAEKDAFIKNLQDTLDMLKSMHESDSKKIDELKTAHEEDARKMDKLISSINDLTAQLKLKNKPVR